MQLHAIRTMPYVWIINCVSIIGARLSEPMHIDRDNVPHTRNNGMYLCIYVSMYHLPTFVAPWFPISVYTLKCSVVYWRAHVRDLQLHALDWTARTTGATRVCHEDYRRRQVGECTDTWYKQIQPTETVHGAVAAQQLTNMPVWIKNDQWAYCTAVLWRLCQQRCDTELTTVPVSFVDVELYRLTVLKHHWHCCTI